MSTKQGFKNFIGNIKKEKDHIRWPKKKKMINGYVNVITVIVLFSAFYVLVDMMLSGILSLIR